MSSLVLNSDTVTTYSGSFVDDATGATVEFHGSTVTIRPVDGINWEFPVSITPLLATLLAQVLLAVETQAPALASTMQIPSNAGSVAAAVAAALSPPVGP